VNDLLALAQFAALEMKQVRAERDLPSASWRRALARYWQCAGQFTRLERL
jgi:hypothetical protein